MTQTHRRLAAILAADVVGYSRLMGTDEEGTLAELVASRACFHEVAERHRGHIVDTAGDSVLAVFASVVEAIQCATDVQRLICENGAALSEDRRMRFRIGINVGDVIETEDGSVYGDGVNVASRLEALAPPGGIVVSESAYVQVRAKLDLEYENMGPQSVKNIAEPVVAFRVLFGGQQAAAGRRPAAATPAPGAPDKPSIAVLPLANMTGDPDQEIFADGLTEDVLTGLSRFRELFVISRNSIMVYKGKARKIDDVARDLGVRYVVEGSVRKAGDRVRVTVQLIDAETDRHVWAERYDRELRDIFAIQDDLTAAIVAVLPGRIQADSHERASRKLPENLEAWENVLAGKVLHHRSRREDNRQALEHLERALAIDPGYAHGHAWKACVLGQAWVYEWSDDRDQTMREIISELQTALALDDNDSDVHRILAAVSLTAGDHEKAVHHQERALSLNPNDDLIVVQHGELLTWLGRPSEGIEWIEKAMRLNPHHPERFWNHLGRANFVGRGYAEAVEAFRRITALDYMHVAFLAASYAQMGNAEQSATHTREVLKLEPNFTVESHLATLHYKRDSDLQHHRDALVKAGLPTGG